MSRKYASTFVQSAMNMSGYSSTQQEFCKIGLRGAGTATGPDGPPFLRGKGLPERSCGAKAAASSKGPRLGQREEILLRAQQAALALHPEPALGFTSTANAEVLPKAKPRALREHFVVPSIRRRDIARAQRSGVRRCEDMLKALDFGNSLFSVHPCHHLRRSVIGQTEADLSMTGCNSSIHL
jgi:hypothetical protein